MLQCILILSGYLPSSVGILCLCEPANYSRRRQLKSENSIEPFEVSRSEFERAAGGVARGREKHLTIEIFHTFGGDELSVDVHEKLRVNFGYYLDVGGSFL